MKKKHKKCDVLKKLWVFLVTNYKKIHVKNPLYAKVMRTKKRATILLHNNHVGSFDCDRTHLVVWHPPNSPRENLSNHLWGRKLKFVKWQCLISLWLIQNWWQHQFFKNFVDRRNLCLLSKAHSFWIHSTCICCILILVTILVEVLPFLFLHITQL